MAQPSREIVDWFAGAWSEQEAITSPKLPASSRAAGDMYRYYAGFADAFVADVVASIPESTDLVLDPWNGSGTTTTIAASHGLSARGFDINPAAVVIAKARLLGSDVAPSVLPLTQKLLSAVEPRADLQEGDLLLRWMTPRAVRSVRRLTSTVERALVGESSAVDAKHLAGEMSSLAALFYLGMFRVVRDSLRPFTGSNPTWLRQKVEGRDRVDFDLRTLRPALIAAMRSLGATVGARGLDDQRHANVEISVSNSGSLPLAEGEIGAVITSPPYCTRIDYGIATLPELATLGMKATEFRELRDHLIGTPTRDGSFAASNRQWGDTANGFLSAVADHDSYAATSYYLPFFSQYFTGMWRSLVEISRVVAPRSPIILVVQDSYFKDVHADVPSAMCEMANALGWEFVDRRDFQVKTRASINPATYKYREPSSATEAVLAFAR